MAENVSCDILIVGGGLAGSALGASMARTGSRVVIVEKEIGMGRSLRTPRIMTTPFIGCVAPNDSAPSCTSR